MDELVAAGGAGCQTDRILYNPTRRAPEIELIPRLVERRTAVMDYSPVEQARLLKHPGLAALAAERGDTGAGGARLC